MSDIRIDTWSVTRGTFTLGPVDLAIKEGEIFALLGRTGSGKSMLLESVLGMYRGKSGKITIGGKDVSESSPSELGIGWLPQDRCLFPHMSVEGNIEFGLRMHGTPKKEMKEKAEELMEMLSIEDLRARMPGTLSGGESQRTALARALALSPEILLLDEPFSALDPATKEGLYSEMLKIHERFGCTTVMVTHDFREAVRLSDRTGILLGGRLHAVKESVSLLDAGWDEETEAFLGRRK